MTIRYSADDRSKLQEAKRIEREARNRDRANRPAKAAAEPKLNGTPGEATPRRFSQRQKLDCYLAQNGRCKDCPAKLPLSEMEMDHEIPLALGGAEDPSNHVMRCAPCHQAKTSGEDIPRIAKAKRQSKLMQPRKPSKRPIRSRGFR